MAKKTKKKEEAIQGIATMQLAPIGLKPIGEITEDLPDAVCGRWLRPKAPPPSASDPAAGGYLWEPRLPQSRSESGPERRNSACSPRSH